MRWSRSHVESRPEPLAAHRHRAVAMPRLAALRDARLCLLRLPVGHRLDRCARRSLRGHRVRRRRRRRGRRRSIQRHGRGDRAARGRRDPFPIACATAFAGPGTPPCLIKADVPEALTALPRSVPVDHRHLLRGRLARARGPRDVRPRLRRPSEPGSTSTCPPSLRATRCARISRLLARAVKPWPGVVDIEEIPPELEAQLEAEVMAEFEASGAGA